MSVRSAFLGERDQMRILGKKSMPGAILLLVAVVALAVVPVLSAVLNAVEYLRYGVFDFTVLLSILEPLRLGLYVLPYALIAIGFLVRKKLIAVIGGVLALISALSDAVICTLWTVMVVVSNILVMLPRLEMLSLGNLIVWMFWRLVNLLNLCMPFIGVLAAAVLLWMLLTAEREGKLSAIATIVTQALQLVTSGLIVVFALIASFLNLIINIHHGYFDAVGLLNYLPPFLAAFLYILLCIALTVLAICVLRGKKAIAAEAAVLAEESTENVLEEQIAENVLEEQIAEGAEPTEETCDSAAEEPVAEIYDQNEVDLKRYEDLLRAGIITMEEFEAKRIEICGL